MSGTVTLDGKPLEGGAISFDPEAVPNNPVSVGAVITDGAYAIPADGGPTPGTYRVSIRSGGAIGTEAAQEAPGLPPKERAKEPILPRYNARSTLKAEVKADGPNTFDFDLESR